MIPPGPNHSGRCRQSCDCRQSTALTTSSAKTSSDHTPPSSLPPPPPLSSSSSPSPSESPRFSSSFTCLDNSRNNNYDGRGLLLRQADVSPHPSSVENPPPINTVNYGAISPPTPNGRGDVPSSSLYSLLVPLLPANPTQQQQQQQPQQQHRHHHFHPRPNPSTSTTTSSSSSKNDQSKHRSSRVDSGIGTANSSSPEITIQPSHHDDCPTPHIDQPSPSDNALRSGRKHAQLYHQSDDLYKGLRNLNQRLRRLLPFLWPRNQLRMQFLIGLLTLLLAAGRIVNILVPYQLKFMIDGLSSPHHPPSFSWIVSQIGFFTLLKLLQGNSGVISTLQNFVWVPVGQYTTKRISVDMFDHLHRLSFRFHINRKTGEILRVQDRGVASVVSVLTSILFNITPTLLDIVLAAYVFGVTFDRYFGVIVLVTMVVYISLTVIMTDWRTRYRRLANQLDNEMEARAVDSLLNFETVKYYNAEPFEIKEYADAVDNYQYAEWKSNLTMNVLNIVQTFTIQAGLAIGALLCARRVLDGRVSVGSFVMYLTYITQLYGPLSWFGSYYRVIQKNFIDMEKMFELFEEPVEIKDAVDSRPLRLDRGEVEFRNVSFTYDSGGQGNSPMTLSNISFKVPAGSTVALVGPSGSGKSTILRLLFRFYDIQSGSILIDGQDIRDVPQNDVRRAIGVVPQDTVLFNDTIRYNIAYGKAGDPTGHVNMDDVVSASRMAQIHDRVIRFPDRYESKVGERGLRLSGGEKQRVAIARTLLKDPAIVCLDEATSALDTQTERNIQSSLREMTADRTTLIIAHRLSTVIHADQILVLHRGRIVERGTHQELLDNPNSMYRDMWMKQLRDEDGVRLCADGASGNNGGSGSSSSSSSNNSSSNNGGGGDNKLTLQHQLCQNNDSEGARATVTLLLQQQPKDQALRSGDLPPVAPITKVVAAAVEAGMAVTTVSTKRNPAGASDSEAVAVVAYPPVDPRTEDKGLIARDELRYHSNIAFSSATEHIVGSYQGGMMAQLPEQQELSGKPERRPLQPQEPPNHHDCFDYVLSGNAGANKFCAPQLSDRKAKPLPLSIPKHNHSYYMALAKSSARQEGNDTPHAATIREFAMMGPVPFGSVPDISIEEVFNSHSRSRNPSSSASSLSAAVVAKCPPPPPPTSSSISSITDGTQ